MKNAITDFVSPMNKIISLSLLFCLTLISQTGWSADAKAGQAKFQTLCATCHGPSGKGDGPAATALNPKPRDLTKTTRSDADLKKIIAKGGTAAGLSPMMPAWGASLSAVEIDNVVAYIRSLKGK